MPGKGKPFEKGKSPGQGRPPGALNKTTRDIKEAYKMLIENNLDNLSSWLTEIAKKNPEKAIYILADLSEFVIPKLARQEVTGKDGGELKISFKPIDFIKDDQNK